jgi:hypothetical protein
MAKVIYPETEKPETLGMEVKIHYQKESNAVEAVINGAMAGAKMLFGIGAMLLAFLGLVALVDKIFAFGGNYINQWSGWGIDFSLKGLFGYLFYPLTIIMGVNPADAFEIANHRRTHHSHRTDRLFGFIHAYRFREIARPSQCGVGFLCSMRICPFCFIGDIHRWSSGYCTFAHQGSV